MRVRVRSVVLTAVALVAVTAAVLGAAQSPFGRIVVFGTSLSDSGNAFALTGAESLPPGYDLDALLVPGAAYARGGHHFSNGATWIEQFARARGLAGSVRPAFASSDPAATNFAIGGARARDDGSQTHLSLQVGAFLQRFGGAAPSDGLYVIEMGANDVRDAIAAYAAGDAQGAGTILQEATFAIANNIDALWMAGARHFLVWRAPDLGLTPAIRMLDTAKPGARFLATQLSVGFNAGLDTALGQLSLLPGITIARLDSFTLLHALEADPSAFDLTNVTAPCVMPNVAPFSCQRPDEFLFWDGIHPTEAAHGILAQEAALQLGQ